MSLLVVVSVLLVAAGGTVVVFTRRPKRQAVTLSMFGLLLTVLFTVLQAPDVALSELVVNALVVPLIILLAAQKVREHK